MKNLRLISFFLILLCAFSVIKGQDRNSFSFIQVTDPQFGFFENNQGFSKETALYEKAVAEINRLHPAFVVITGDLVNNKDSKEQIAEFKRITSLIDKAIPVYFSPGNHDTGQDPRQEDIDRFISNYGHDRFSFRYHGSLFIGLNSNLIKSGTPGLEQAQFEWLQKELRKGKRANNTVIFTHHPFFINKPDEPDEYFNIPSETRKRYLEVFSMYGVDMIVAGHLHNNGYGKTGNIEMITTSAVGKPLSTAPSGMRIFTVYPDRIENTYYPLP